MPSLLPLTDSILALSGDMREGRPWLGVVLTAAGTVLIDSGNGPLHAAALQGELARLGAAPVTHILLTHHHWDHVFGSVAFPAAIIVAHTQTQAHLQRMAVEPWSREYVNKKGEQFPRGKIVSRLMNAAVPDWSQFRALPAHITFEAWHELEVGGTRFFIEHVGGQHEPDQCLVLVQPGNVLFVGDVPYGRGPKEQWNREALSAELQHCVDSGAAWFVEGHRAPADLATFQARQRALLEDEGEE